MTDQRREARVNVPGFAPFSLALHPPGELVSDHLAAHGVWEPYESAVFASLLEPGSWVIDAGANLGYYTCLAAQRVGAGGRVIAFEPDADNFRLLTRNSRHLGADVDVRRQALGAAAGTTHLVDDAQNKGDVHVSACGATAVEAVRGDDLALDRLDLVKIDTQGAEVGVLRGLRDTLARNRDASILLEAWPWGLRRAGSSAAELLDVLLDLDRPAHLLDHQAHRTVPLAAAALRRLLLETLTLEQRGFVNLLLTGRTL